MEIKAKLHTTLASENEKIKTLVPFKNNDFDCYKEIKYNAKIRLRKEEGPLEIKFHY